MALTRIFGRIVAAVAVLAAVCLAPTLASAHAGHAHGTPVAATIAHDDGPAVPATIVATAIAADTAAQDHGGRLAPSTPDCDCDGCCGMTATCCGVALAPTAAGLAGSNPPLPFLTRGMQALHGLPPEALPKPPRSFA